MRSLLILEDNPEFIEIYKDILEPIYHVDFVQSIEELEQIQSSYLGYSGFIADMNLKDGNFLEWIIDKQSSFLEKLPTIIVSSIDDIQALRTAYEWGARDYITKPFKKNELIVKLERIFNLDLRGDLTLIKENFLDGLTLVENKIFNSMCEKKGAPISRDELVRIVWKKVKVSSKTLDVHLSNLRKKLSDTCWQIDSTENGWKIVKK